MATLSSSFFLLPSSQPALPVKAFPTHLCTQTAGTSPLAPSSLLFQAVITAADGRVRKIYAAFIAVTGPVFTLATATTGGFHRHQYQRNTKRLCAISGQRHTLSLTGTAPPSLTTPLLRGPAAAFEVGPSGRSTSFQFFERWGAPVVGETCQRTSE